MRGISRSASASADCKLPVLVGSTSQTSSRPTHRRQHLVELPLLEFVAICVHSIRFLLRRSVKRVAGYPGIDNLRLPEALVPVGDPQLGWPAPGLTRLLASASLQRSAERLKTQSSPDRHAQQVGVGYAGSVGAQVRELPSAVANALVRHH